MMLDILFHFIFYIMLHEHVYIVKSLRPNIGPSNLSNLLDIKLTKNITLRQVFSCNFASAVYLPTFSTSGNLAYIDSSRHKASEQQATTPAGN